MTPASTAFSSGVDSHRDQIAATATTRSETNWLLQIDRLLLGFEQKRHLRPLRKLRIVAECERGTSFLSALQLGRFAAKR
jgi:hypothetical protein